MLYNDQSVLESFHTMTLFRLLQKHGFHTLLGGTASNEYQEFRRLVISTIMATDMALHGDYVHRLKQQIHPVTWDQNSLLEEKLLFCSGMIKCADISNVARPFSLAYQWSQVLIDEFTAQGDLERELGMDVLPNNDRNKIDLEEFQIGFIQYMALGLYQSMSDYMQGLSFPMDQMQANLSIWKERKERKMNPEESPSTTVVDEEDYFKLAARTLNESEPKLPKMPTIAMSTYHYETHEEGWTPGYCQCMIQ